MQKREMIRISNAYYNAGLSYAKQINLCMAIMCLKKSLEYNKSNINARNLLGLLYYETGEIALALLSWVISINIKKNDNIADIYIYEVQKKSDRMRLYKDLTFRYNQALIDANEFNKDLAILSLSRVVEANPKFIKAALLLSLLYLEKKDFKRAKKVLKNILKIDKYNFLALKYKQYADESLKNIVKNSNDDTTSYIISDTIIPSTYKAYSGTQTFINIFIGLLIGASFIMFLYIPTMKTKLNNIHNKEMLVVSEKLNTVNIDKEKLGKKLDDVIKERDALKELSNTSKENINYKSTQYQKLLAMSEALNANDLTRLADIYSDFDPNSIDNIDDGTDFDISILLNKIKEKVDAGGSMLLLKHADTFYDKKDYDNAIIYYDKSLKLDKNNIDALLNKAKALKKLQKIEDANTIFSDIIINYPDTEQARAAGAERGY